MFPAFLAARAETLLHTLVVNTLMALLAVGTPFPVFWFVAAVGRFHAPSRRRSRTGNFASTNTAVTTFVVSSSLFAIVFGHV